MKNLSRHNWLLWIIMAWLVLASCSSQSSNAGAKANQQKKIPLPENGFCSGLLDSKGNIWLGSNGGGVFRYDGKAFTHYTRNEGLSSKQVFSIVEDSRNNLWFGTQKGLSRYDGKRFQHIPLPFQDTTGVWLDKVYPIISPHAVHALATDQHDNLWIGTAGGGAYRYDGTSFTPFLRERGRKQEDSLYHNWIPFIAEDQQGNMWFASMTHGGICRFDGEKVTPYLTKDGLSDDMVRTIFCDSAGNLWIGFNGNRESGLTRFDGKSFHTFSEEDGLCNKRIRAIYEDARGHLWLGAGLGNLCVYDGQTFSEFKMEGQTFSDILFILDDSEGNIWFGGSNGLWVFDGQVVTEMTKNRP